MQHLAQVNIQFRFDNIFLMHEKVLGQDLQHRQHTYSAQNGFNWQIYTFHTLLLLTHHSTTESTLKKSIHNAFLPTHTLKLHLIYVCSSPYKSDFCPYKHVYCTSKDMLMNFYSAFLKCSFPLQRIWLTVFWLGTNSCC